MANLIPEMRLSKKNYRVMLALLATFLCVGYALAVYAVFHYMPKLMHVQNTSFFENVSKPRHGADWWFPGSFIVANTITLLIDLGKDLSEWLQSRKMETLLLLSDVILAGTTGFITLVVSVLLVMALWSIHRVWWRVDQPVEEVEKGLPISKGHDEEEEGISGGVEWKEVQPLRKKVQPMRKRRRAERNVTPM